ncbi:hypothetical protein [Listeria booriae]|uniref:Uncharacterized protein n=1 Tax=Listeria booriae TaxID=1552123 RepID=A0A7X0WF42_9LIST|nr:hypothetical protein [Listeria booriae]MBC1273637.1 hypothetical protein [Listeria booriae]MBC1308521.1 hypothetical protein [Listeria booriae]MBC1332670.1 hypothetical protein [Listeria booriae]MBC2189640.1 hypothetical protein [Listeria booriae]MBC2259605.1 hypothetical protein [Listeria booriae]
MKMRKNVFNDFIKKEVEKRATRLAEKSVEMSCRGFSYETPAPTSLLKEKKHM